MILMTVSNGKLFMGPDVPSAALFIHTRERVMRVVACAVSAPGAYLEIHVLVASWVSDCFPLL